MHTTLISRVLIAAAFATLGLLAALGTMRDFTRPALPKAELHELSRIVSHRIDNGRLMDAGALLESLAARPFTPPDGRPLTVGNRFFEDGLLWVSAPAPELGASSDWALWLDDGRAQQARLILSRNGAVLVRDWVKSADPSGGIGLAKPVFHLTRDELSGATIHLGFTSFGALKGDVLIAPRSIYEAVELREYVRFGLLTGAMAAIAVFLLVMAIRLRDKAAFYASALSVALAIRISGDVGLLQVMALDGFPGLSDVILYGTQPLSITFWLLFVVSFMQFDVTRPRAAFWLRLLAAIIPFQGVFIVLRGGFIPDLPFNISVASPTLIGVTAGMGLLFWLAFNGDRRARAFALCMLPLFIGMLVRLYNYYIFNPPVPLGPLKHTGLDLVLSMTALATLIAIDIQQRETRLKQTALTNEGRYRDYAEIGADGVLEVDGDGVILSSAGPLARSLKLSPGTPFHAALAAVPQPLLEAMRSAPVRNAEFRVGPQEALRWISISSLPLDGNAGYRAVVSDISEQVAGRETQARRDTLAALGQLAGGIAHEVNNLLHPMINLSRRVSGRLEADPDGRRLLDLVVTSGERAGEIVRQVLKAYAPERMTGAVKPADDAVHEALETIRATLPATITLETLVEPVPGLALNSGETIQVMSNLANNAVKAMRGVGRLSIRLTAEPDAARLVVADNGPGMDEAVRRQALEPFVTASQGGIGLGLSIVQRIVAGWRGRIEIDSKPGSGATIRIVIPRQAAQASGAAP